MKALATHLSSLVVAGAAACLVPVLSACLSDLHWTFDMAGQFLLPALWGLMAGAVLLIVLLPFSKTRFLNLAAANVAVIVAALGWYGIWPNSAGEQTPGAIKVYQHNIWAKNPNPDRAVQGALASGADIAVFVEAFDEVLRVSNTSLDERWPYNSGRLPNGQNAGWLKLYSRFEIISVDAQLPDNTPSMLEARLRLPEGELTVLVVHFTRPWPFDTPHAQLRQLAGLARKVSTIDGPLIMLGDVNSAAWGRIAEPLERDLGFQMVSDPRAGTWPARFPPKYQLPSVSWPPALAIPIDLAFCRGDIVCGDHKVGGHFGSDHRSATFTASLKTEGSD